MVPASVTESTSVAFTVATSAAPTTASPARPTVVLSVEVDRNQVNSYAVASSPAADFLAETLYCANLGKETDNERYCYLYRTADAFGSAGVDPDTGDFARACWVAFGGAGVGEQRADRSDVYVDEGLDPPIDGCPEP